MAPPVPLPHSFIHLMLELLFLPQHTTASAPPSQHPSASADLSLHRTVIDMSSIYHAPTAEDYLHPAAALASTYRHAETFLGPPTAPAFNHHPAVNASSSSVSCFCTSFFSASASISTLPLLVVFYNLSRLFDDH